MKTVTFSCGHRKQAPDYWEDVISQPCDTCDVFQTWNSDVPDYSPEEIEEMSKLQQQIEDYGFDLSFEV